MMKNSQKLVTDHQLTPGQMPPETSASPVPDKSDKHHHLPTRRSSLLLVAALVVLGVMAAGQHKPPPTPPGQIADISADDLRSALADLSRANGQKVELAFYAGLPWQGVNAPFDTFYKQMGKEQKDLSNEIEAWAKKNHVDLAYHYSKDVPGEAQKILEAREEKLVRGDSKADFTRDTLMQMYQDYEWQLSETQALLPHVKDPELKAYLEHNLKIHTAGSDQIIGLLRRFKAS